MRHACGLVIHCPAGHCAAMTRERRVHGLLRREIWKINPKKSYRVYKELGMPLRNKTPKRRLKATARKIGIRTGGDTFSRYFPVLDARFTDKGENVVATLDRICRKTGCLRTIRLD